MSRYKPESSKIFLFGKRRKLLQLLVALVAIAGFVTGCSVNSNNAGQPDLYFPVKKKPDTIILDSLISGKLVVNGGYFRVRGIWPLKGSLIIWPYGYSWKAENDEIWIIDNEDQAVVRVGDSVKIRGGEIPKSFAEEKIGYPLPPGIKGPFWSAGEIVDD